MRNVDEPVLRKIQKGSEKNTVSLLCRKPKSVGSEKGYEKLRRLRGKVKFSMDWKSLREDS